MNKTEKKAVEKALSKALKAIEKVKNNRFLLQEYNDLYNEFQKSYQQSN